MKPNTKHKATNHYGQWWVWDKNGTRVIAMCTRERDARMIARALNRKKDVR